MDGAAMSRTIRSDPEHKDIPIVMMSGLPEGNVRERFNGYAEFLRKPFYETDLLRVVTKVLGVEPKTLS